MRRIALVTIFSPALRKNYLKILYESSLTHLLSRVKDSDSLIEEIDIFLDGDDSIPPGIESDDYDSEDDDNSTSRPEFESFHVDYPDSGDSTIDYGEDTPWDVPEYFAHPSLPTNWIFNFIPSLNDLGYRILMILLLPEIEQN
ncbi:hypothetical protein Tco_0741664 [Tanacetum coccineum]